MGSILDTMQNQRESPIPPAGQVRSSGGPGFSIPRSVSPARGSALDHLLDVTGELAGHFGALAELPLPLAGLLGQDMALHGVIAQHLAGTGHLEALLGAAMGLLLGQLSSPSCSTPAPRSTRSMPV